MRDTYLFDKRVVKKALIKFFVSCLVAFPVLVAFNLFTSDMFEFWVSVLLDSVILLVFFVICSGLVDKAYERAEQKRAKKRAQYDEVFARKNKAIEDSKKQQEIMQNSYKKIREEKLKKKAEKEANNKKEDEVSVEEDTNA